MAERKQRDNRRRAASPKGAEDRPPTYSGEKVRQGEIILRTRTRRLIFFGGLAGFVVLAIVLRILGAF